MNNNNQPPPWSEAPKWAKWRTVDADGEITFWEYEPRLLSDCFGKRKGRLTVTGYDFTIDLKTGEYPNWRDTLEKRPDNE